MPTKLAKDRGRNQRERIVNKVFTLPVITTCKVVTYKRIGIIFLNFCHMCYKAPQMPLKLRRKL
jgi:hypothetical protein